jgi:hypothetical protein
LRRRQLNEVELRELREIRRILLRMEDSLDRLVVKPVPTIWVKTWVRFKRWAFGYRDVLVPPMGYGGFQIPGVIEEQSNIITRTWRRLFAETAEEP